MGALLYAAAYYRLLVGHAPLDQEHPDVILGPVFPAWRTWPQE